MLSPKLLISSLGVQSIRDAVCPDYTPYCASFWSAGILIVSVLESDSLKFLSLLVDA